MAPYILLMETVLSLGPPMCTNSLISCHVNKTNGKGLLRDNRRHADNSNHAGIWCLACELSLAVDPQTMLRTCSNKAMEVHFELLL